MDDGDNSITDIEWYEGPIYDDGWEDDEDERTIELTEEQKAEIRRREEEWIALTDCSLQVQAIFQEYMHK